MSSRARLGAAAQARAVRGARLRARAAGSAVQSARACRLAPRAARPGSRRPSGFRARCLDAVAVAARAGGFPRAPAPSPAAPPLLPPRSHTQNSLSASLPPPPPPSCQPSRAELAGGDFAHREINPAVGLDDLEGLEGGVVTRRRRRMPASVLALRLSPGPPRPSLPATPCRPGSSSLMGPPSGDAPPVQNLCLAPTHNGKEEEDTALCTPRAYSLTRNYLF
ncbi:atherin-like [Canis lupus familiaris]|uniref:atherin-like n=1 Tax=Canis lupus familiaris TaxID=9615 RepID=UPI0018F4335D|nr:atherin-like [Canis lupus familiaris]